MKIELDVSADQLIKLDSGLKDLLSNLTEDQQVQLIQNYVDRQLDNLTYMGEYGNQKYTKFGDKLISGLQSKITESISDKILSNKKLQEEIQEISNNVIDHLPDIVEKSISSYLCDNLFNDKSKIQGIIDETLFNIRMGRRS